jgi:hypothetical protein
MDARMRCTAVALGLVIAVLVVAQASAQQSPPPEAKSIVLVSHFEANDGGESMAIQQWPDGRRWLYYVHQAREHCLSVIDVTRPESPELVTYLPSPYPGTTHCNSLGLSENNVLAVANWIPGSYAGDVGAQPSSRGMWVLDVSDPARIRRAKTLQDLAFSFFDTSGPQSRGVHWLWFVDGEFAHMTTGTSDSRPTDDGHDQFYMVVDLRDPRHPREVARWWVPGTQQGDACLPGCLPHGDHPSRLHNVQVYPERPDRAYIGYFGSGWMIMDISGLDDVRAGRAQRFKPTLVSQFRAGPLYPANAHTLQPIFSRGLAWAGDEATQVADGPNKCIDSPKMLWLVDIREETSPFIVGSAPFPANAHELCQRPGRYGPFNLHPNLPLSTSKKLENTMVATYFGGGVRIFRIVDVPGLGNVPPRVVEIAHFIPEAPPRNRTGTSQMGGVLVGDDGLIYANDRLTGGLYLLRYTGTEPLD